MGSRGQPVLSCPYARGVSRHHQRFDAVHLNNHDVRAGNLHVDVFVVGIGKPIAVVTQPRARRCRTVTYDSIGLQRRKLPVNRAYLAINRRYLRLEGRNLGGIASNVTLQRRYVCRVGADLRYDIRKARDLAWVNASLVAQNRLKFD